MTSTNKPRVANPIAIRRYAVVGEPGRQVVVTIGKPRPEPDPSVWMCSFLIEGISPSRRLVARGVDALDALQNAIEATRGKLRECGLSLSLEGCPPGDIAIRRPVPSFPGSDLEERIERHIDRELKKFYRLAQAQSDARNAPSSNGGAKGHSPRRRATRSK